MDGSISFLDEIIYFPTSKNEFHVYIGTETDPRSTMIIIRGNRITQPIRVPPLRLETLIARYENRIDEKLKIDHKLKLLFSILNLKKYNLIETKDEQEDKENNIHVMDWKEFKKGKLNDNQNIIPITNELVELNMYPEKQEKLLLLLITLISSPSRSKRQEALMNLLRFKETGYCLIYILFWIREEITISIIREAGRQKKKINFVLENCLNLVQLGDETYEKFARGYIDQFRPEAETLANIRQQEKLFLTRFLKKSSKKRIYDLLKPLSEFDPQTKKVFRIFRIITDHETFERELKNLIEHLNRKKIKKEFLHIGLIDLFQYGEAKASPKIIATACLIASLFDEISYNGELIFFSELKNEFRHLANRTLSLLYLWKSLRKRDLILEFLRIYLSMYPEPLKMINLPNHSEIGKQWLKSHYILKNFTKEIEKVWENEDWILHIAVNQSISHFPIIKSLLDVRLDPKDYQIDNLTTKVLLSQNYINFENLVETIEPGRIVSDQFFDKVFPNLTTFRFLTSCKLVLSKETFSVFVLEVLKLGENEFNSLIEYIKMVSSLNKPILDDYFEIIRGIILKRYSYDDPEPTIKSFIINIIVRWASITSSFINEKIQNLVDTFKIIYQQDIGEDFDLESSKPLSIETIAECYNLANGDIPKFVESNIQFSFTKPVWDQLARHYLALGVSRPKRESIANSKLKEVPNYLLRDVLGQIALVNQTLNYCERNGFRPPLENLIINNMYRRGWNVERGLERTIPSYFGSFSPRLRAYFCAYLVIEQGEISLDILSWARNVEDYLIRDRIVRELERYGTPNMWVVLANSYHEDIQKRSLQQIKESRMSPSDRSKIIVDLLTSPRKNVWQMGLDLLEAHGVQQEELSALFFIENELIFEKILDYILSNSQHFTSDHQEIAFEYILKHTWIPGYKAGILEKLGELSNIIVDVDKKEKIRSDLLSKLNSLSSSQIDTTISQLSHLD